MGDPSISINLVPVTATANFGPKYWPGVQSPGRGMKPAVTGMRQPVQASGMSFGTANRVRETTVDAGESPGDVGGRAVNQISS
jgi:hypothetical protein